MPPRRGLASREASSTSSTGPTKGRQDGSAPGSQLAAGGKSRAWRRTDWQAVGSSRSRVLLLHRTPRERAKRHGKPGGVSAEPEPAHHRCSLRGSGLLPRAAPAAALLATSPTARRVGVAHDERVGGARRHQLAMYRLNRRGRFLWRRIPHEAAGPALGRGGGAVQTHSSIHRRVRGQQRRAREHEHATRRAFAAASGSTGDLASARVPQRSSRASPAHCAAPLPPDAATLCPPTALQRSVAHSRSAAAAHQEDLLHLSIWLKDLRGDACTTRINIQHRVSVT